MGIDVKDGPAERYRAPALDKGLDILELLSEQPRGMTRGEIVRAMGRSPSEIYRMLERLVARDYVSRSPEGDRYALTIKLFVLAHRHPPVRRLVARATPVMDRFARLAGQSCHLVVPERGTAVVAQQVSSAGSWEFGIRVGTEIDLLGSGSGQVLLAFRAPEAVADLLAFWEGSDRAQRLKAIEPSLAQYRRAGYRAAPSLQIEGVEDLTVPVLSPDGYAAAALTCPFIRRLDRSDQPGRTETLNLLREAGGTISVD
ncbi:MAG: IclR family transcriptional regulator [Devosia sp.]